MPGFQWFVTDGGTGSKPRPPDKYLPPGGSYGIPTFAPRRDYVVAYWPVALLFALLPATWLMSHGRYWRERLRGEGRCIRCGYDLRATPNRCPECGAVLTSQ